MIWVANDTIYGHVFSYFDPMIEINLSGLTKAILVEPTSVSGAVFIGSGVPDSGGLFN